MADIVRAPTLKLWCKRPKPAIKSPPSLKLPLSLLTQLWRTKAANKRGLPAAIPEMGASSHECRSLRYKFEN